MENRVNQHHLAHNQPDDPDGYSCDLDDADPDDPTRRPEWEHLRPERIRIGSIGVFAGDWAWTAAADSAMRIPVAFVGTLIDRFFRTTKITDTYRGLGREAASLSRR